MTGILVVISGPSGVGKGTIIKLLKKEMPELVESVSFTTRVPRTGEQNGREYHFVTNKEFSRKVEHDEFLEWAHVHSNQYGTDAALTAGLMQKGKDVLLEIDVQGAEIIRGKMPRAVLIFLAPPGMQELEARLRGRNTEKESEVVRRLEVARQEINMQKNYKYVVENKDIADTVTQVKKIINSERRK